MGMFDTVLADCPTCGHKVSFQSKAGHCAMDTFLVDDAPTVILMDVMNYPRYCAGCGNWFCLTDPSIPPGFRPNLAAIKVRQPENPHIHSAQSELRWWDEPFTADDIIAIS